MGCASSAPIDLASVKADDTILPNVRGNNAGDKLVFSYPMLFSYLVRNKETISFKWSGDKVGSLRHDRDADGYVLSDESGKMIAFLRTGTGVLRGSTALRVLINSGALREAVAEQWQPQGPVSSHRFKFVQTTASLFCARMRHEGQAVALDVAGHPLYEWAQITNLPCDRAGSNPHILNFAWLVHPREVDGFSAAAAIVFQHREEAKDRITNAAGDELIASAASTSIASGCNVDPLLVALTKLAHDDYASLFSGGAAGGMAI